jgi:hypothetical protein
VASTARREVFVTAEVDSEETILNRAL